MAGVTRMYERLSTVSGYACAWKWLLAVIGFTSTLLLPGCVSHPPVLSPDQQPTMPVPHIPSRPFPLPEDSSHVPTAVETGSVRGDTGCAAPFLITSFASEVPESRDRVQHAVQTGLRLGVGHIVILHDDHDKAQLLGENLASSIPRTAALRRISFWPPLDGWPDRAEKDVPAPLLFVSAEMLKGAPSDPRSAAVLNRISSSLNSLLPGCAPVVILDRVVWEDTRYPGWPALYSLLRADTVGGTVIAAAGDRYSYWDWGGLRFITAPLSTGDGDSVPGLDRLDSRDCCLWVNPRDGAAAATVLNLAGTRPVEFFSRQRQLERKRIRETLHATVASDRYPVTTVRCSNPTASRLEFSTKWEFAEPDVTVQPQILSFTLEPGEAFRQMFRFVREGRKPLKFAMPTLILTGPVSERTLPNAELTLRLVPECRFSGAFSVLEKAPLIDGNLNEWTGPAYVLGHTSQVQAGERYWTGPADASAQVYAGVCDATLYFAVAATDDTILNDSVDGTVTFYLDLRSPHSDAAVGSEFESGTDSAAVVTFRENGAHSVNRETGRYSVIHARTLTNRMRVTEFAVSGPAVTRLLQDKSRTLLFDIALTDKDGAGGKETLLFFSGTVRNPETSEYYADFRLPDSTAVSGDAQ